MTDNAAKKAAVKAKHDAKLARELERLKGLGDDPDVVWAPEVAAMFLGVTPGALQKWRRHGGGPTYLDLSKTRVGYQKSALVAWLKSRQRQSTSESASPEAAK